MSENVGSHDLHIKQSDNFSLFDTSWLFASTDLFYIIPIMTSPHSKKHNQSQSPICESYTGREILPTQPMHFFQGNSCKIIIQFASSLVITKWVPFFMIPELWRRQSSLLKQPPPEMSLKAPVKVKESPVPHSSRGSGSCHTHPPRIP